MSEIESPYVYRGAWLDHEKGAIIGKTITTDTRTGTIIIAILAILSSLATTHLWHLVTFCYHQYRAGASRLRSDAAFKQQQVLLRTLASPGALVADLTKIYWAWRKTDSKQPLLNWLPFTTLAALFAVASVAVGILSSYIVDTSNLQILVQSPFCGPLIIEPDSAAQDVAGIYRPTVQELALPLVQECYKNNVSDSARCRVFTKPRIPFKVTRDVCPWTSSMCDLQSNISTVTMDSGHLDMNEAFGLNLPPNNGVMFRKKTSCAVLSLRNRTTIVPMSAFPGYPRPPLPQEELLIVSFGHFAGNRTWRNSTFAISLATTNVTTDFTSFSQPSYVAWENQYFNPLPGLMREDADLVLKMFSKNRVLYENPVNDPIFSAHKRYVVPNERTGMEFPYYLSDFPVAVVGCAQQFQFCVSQGTCTKLSFIPRNLTVADFPEASDVQLALLEVLVRSAYVFDIVSSQLVDASARIDQEGFIKFFPDDQWVKEIVSLESQVWASLQVAIADYFIGAKARDRFAEKYSRPATDEGEKNLCVMMKMRRSGGFVNINVFALAFVIALSVFIVTLDITILRFLIFVSKLRHTRWLGRHINHWIQDGVLQLQRRVYEARDEGPWEDTQKEIPIMPKPIALSDLTRDSSDELLMLSTSDGCSKAPLKKDKQQEEQIFEDDGGDMAHFEGEKHLVEYPVGFSKKA